MLNIDGKTLDELNAEEYYLISILLNYGKKSHPDNDVLTKKTGWGIEKVQKTKKSLVKKGFLLVSKRFQQINGVTKRASNQYLITSKLLSKYNGLKSQLLDFQVVEIQLDEIQVHEIQLHEKQIDNQVLKLTIIETIKVLKENIKRDYQKRILELEEKIKSISHSIPILNTQDAEKEKTCAKKEKHELWLLGFYETENTEYLQKFTKQPTNDQLAKIKSRIKEQGLIEVLRKIEEYCVENPSYAKKRKDLPRIIATFSKDFDKPSVTALKSVFDKEYQKRFKEQYAPKKTYTNHIETILTKLEAGLKVKYSDSTKLEIEAQFEKVLSRLPEKYNSPTQFKIEFISSNFQELQLHCKTSRSIEKGSKQGLIKDVYANFNGKW